LTLKFAFPFVSVRFNCCVLTAFRRHAAIDESVELAKRAGHRFASGMVTRC